MGFPGQKHGAGLRAYHGHRRSDGGERPAHPIPTLDPFPNLRQLRHDGNARELCGQDLHLDRAAHLHRSVQLGGCAQQQAAHDLDRGFDRKVPKLYQAKRGNSSWSIHDASS